MTFWVMEIVPVFCLGKWRLNLPNGQKKQGGCCFRRKRSRNSTKSLKTVGRNLGAFANLKRKQTKINYYEPYHSPQSECKYDLISLGEIMLRLAPRGRPNPNISSIQCREGGGEYNVARGLRRCFWSKYRSNTAFADNEIGRLIEDFILVEESTPHL